MPGSIICEVRNGVALLRGEVAAKVLNEAKNTYCDSRPETNGVSELRQFRAAYAGEAKTREASTDSGAASVLD